MSKLDKLDKLDLNKIKDIGNMIQTLEKGKKVTTNVQDVVDNYKKIEENFKASKKELDTVAERTYEYLSRIINDADEYATNLDNTKKNKFTNEIHYLAHKVYSFWKEHGLNTCYKACIIIFILVLLNFAFVQSTAFLMLVAAICFILNSSVGTELNVDRVKDDVQLLREEIKEIKELAKNITDFKK